MALRQGKNSHDLYLQNKVSLSQFPF